MMNIQMLTDFFMWCTIINIIILCCAFFIWLIGADYIYKLHSKCFHLPSRETFNFVFYSFLGLYKILVYVFNLVPWIALLIIS